MTDKSLLVWHWHAETSRRANFDFACLYSTSFSTKTGSGNDVTYSEEETVDVERLSLHNTDPSAEPRANDDAILSRDDDLMSRDTGAGAKPKTLQRKNTPAVLPKVASLYGSSSPCQSVSVIVLLS